MPDIWLGCSGWAYDDWVGPFYPTGTPAGEFLERYARVFRTVEVDSSFYRAPTPFLVRRWADRTPAGFRFALKVPRDVTHEPDEAAGAEVLRRFLASLAPLRDAGKLGPLVLQFPASFRAPAGAPKLERWLGDVPVEYSLAVELRHDSWWVPSTRSALEARRAALVWSIVPGTEPPPWVTTDFVYARFVGDRALTRFDRIQRDRRADVERMRERFRNEARSVGAIYGYSNNHFMGFGPATVAVISESLGAPRPDLSAAARSPGQRTLGETSPSGAAREERF
ncbi:MAG TPA: DUF72 domain-containing protein [Thermoplasmata archaeon]|nr:DUF72 domain-containing protein [Thermoplasmata archaeon]